VRLRERLLREPRRLPHRVTFTAEQWGLIERFRGVMGSGDAEIVRNIVLTWLAEKSVVSESIKKDMRTQKGGEE